MPAPEARKVLITVRTYPTPALKGLEVSCTAGLTTDNKWIRLFPLPYRYLPADKRFSKYQWVELNVTKASDHRPESYNPHLDSIRIVSDPLPTRDAWRARRDALATVQAHCMCCLRRERDQHGFPTLGFFKPKAITKLEIEPDTPDWTPAELGRLRQTSMFSQAPPKELEKIPFKFRYRFTCDHADCAGHRMLCTDWEMSESYRQWQAEYGTAWEAAFRRTYETRMIRECDTHLYVGTTHGQPNAWIIVGLFYPPPQLQSPLL